MLRREVISMVEPRKLEGKVAIVTGAGSSGEGFGTGKAISVLFAHEGASVLLVDKEEDRAKETLRLIEEEGGEATVFVTDLSVPSSCPQIVEATTSRYGAINILVNNAAISATTSLLDTTQKLYDQVIAVNLTAPFMLTKAALPAMIDGGGGSIVNITSIAAMRGTGGRGQTAYAASKAGLMGLTIDVSDSYGNQGIRINCVAPGIIDTPMRANAMAQAGLKPGDIDLSTKTSVGFEGDAWDIARAALFLAGPDGRFITGVLLPVDGGTTAQSH